MTILIIYFMQIMVRNYIIITVIIVVNCICVNMKQKGTKKFVKIVLKQRLEAVSSHRAELL